MITFNNPAITETRRNSGSRVIVHLLCDQNLNALVKISATGPSGEALDGQIALREKGGDLLAPQSNVEFRRNNQSPVPVTYRAQVFGDNGLLAECTQIVQPTP